MATPPGVFTQLAANGSGYASAVTTTEPLGYQCGWRQGFCQPVTPLTMDPRLPLHDTWATCSLTCMRVNESMHKPKTAYK